MKRSRRDTYRSSSRTRVDIVPLIDVIFLLLAFFMFLTMSMVFQKGMPVDLAKAGTGESVKKQENTVVVSIKKNGGIYWNEQRLDQQTLANRLDQLSKSDDENGPRIHVNADEQARHGDVVAVVDLIRDHDIDEVIFTVKSSQ